MVTKTLVALVRARGAIHRVAPSPELEVRATLSRPNQVRRDAEPADNAEARKFDVRCAEMRLGGSGHPRGQVRVVVKRDLAELHGAVG